MTRRSLTAALSRFPDTASALIELERIPVSPISKAFAPMVRELRYDVCEMAIATFLMAKEAGVPITLLPVVMVQRFQEAALLCRADSGIRGPIDLPGMRIGVRAYSQTTGMWIRGVLAEAHGVTPDVIAWTTFEDAHVPSFRDPPFVSRAVTGKTLEGMLRSGELDAAIFGTEIPEGLRPVFPDVAAAEADFRARHGFVPVNHLAVVRSELARDAALVAELVRLFGTSATTREALDPVFALAGRWCAAQGLIARPLTAEEIWR